MIKILLIGIGLIIILFVIYEIYQQTHFIVREYNISSEKLKGLKREVKIVLLTDLHNKEYGKNNIRLIEKIDSINPDFILVAGDLMVAKPGKDCKIALELMKSLSPKYTCFYGNGNHEYRMKIYKETYGDLYNEYAGKLRDIGVNLLENTHISIPLNGKNINIYGLEADREYYKRFSKTDMKKDYIDKVLGEANFRDFNILIAHNPKYFENYAEWGADLSVSGHLHGGLVRLPFVGGVASPQIEFFPKYSDGMYKIEDKYMVLSCGLGTHTINIRVNNPAELSLIRLKAK